MPALNHSRRKFLTLGAGAAGLTAIGAFGSAAWLKNNQLPNSLRSHNRTSWALGADVSLTVLHADEPTARRALDAAFAELDTIENALSLYRPHSQIVRLNRDGSLDKPHAHFRRVLNASQDMSRQSNGAFDVTVQPLWDLYFSAKKQNALPNNSEIEAARAKVDWRKINVTPERISFNSPGMKITFNGIAQGYAADRVLSVLRENGIEHALVDAGELTSFGRKADGSPYKSGIQHPRQPDSFAAVCALDGRALATSGDYATTFSDDFVYNHIFNPGTGRSPAEFSSVSIMAPTGILADALSKPVFILGQEKGLAFLNAIPNCDAYLIRKDGRTFATKNFPLVS